MQRGVPVVWRAHIGVDEPNDLAREAWHFLTPYVEPADAYIFSRAGYVWEGLDPRKVSVIPPSIDAFAPKNATLTFTGRDGGAARGRACRRRSPPVAGDLRAARRQRGPVTSKATLVEERALRLDEPLLAQVSRWDRLKDPIGVLEALRRARALRRGPSPAAGRPRRHVGRPTTRRARRCSSRSKRRGGRFPRAARRRVHLALLPMNDADENAVIVNALQRRSDVVAQKSLAEGFGLTVSEAMWKARPVVASDVGGIREQIEDGRTGFLVDPRDLEAFGRHVSELIADPHDAERMGEAGQARVREHFLGPRHLGAVPGAVRQAPGRPLSPPRMGRRDYAPVPAAARLVPCTVADSAGLEASRCSSSSIRACRLQDGVGVEAHRVDAELDQVLGHVGIVRRRLAAEPRVDAVAPAALDGQPDHLLDALVALVVVEGDDLAVAVDARASAA